MRRKNRNLFNMDKEQVLGKQELKAMRSKQALIDAAAKLFREKNINSVGVREISAMAGVTTGTFYHYFDSKDSILDAIYLNRDEQFEEILSKYSEKGPFCHGLICFFKDYMASLVKEDGVDYTLHRMFVLKKKSPAHFKLTQGVVKLIESAQNNDELGSQYNGSDIADFMFVLFRGVVYDWCITENGSQDLSEKVEKALTCAIKAFEN